MIKATKHQGLAGYRFLIALAAISLFPAGRADCFAGIPVQLPLIQQVQLSKLKS